MLTIKESEDKALAERFLHSHGEACSLAEKIVMQCEENGKVLGVASLCLSGGKVYFNQLTTAEEDSALRLGLAKSLLNLADLRGIKTVYGSNKALERIYIALRFQKTEEEYSVSLEGYFTAGHCE